MSEATTATAPETTTDVASEKKKVSLVDSIFDLGLEWATFGIKTGQTALEAAAKTLQGTAKALEHVSSELGKKA